MAMHAPLWACFEYLIQLRKLVFTVREKRVIARNIPDGWTVAGRKVWFGRVHFLYLYRTGENWLLCCRRRFAVHAREQFFSSLRLIQTNQFNRNNRVKQSLEATRTHTNRQQFPLLP